jgi:dGTPase
LLDTGAVPAIREEKEERELSELAPFAIKSRHSRGRRHPESDDPLRTCFERDRDRVIHCAAFRRLEAKTQVIVLPESDHPRTRLTHTLEVVQVARSVATALRLNEPYVECVALAHDLGHPPFGHAGEEVLAGRMKSHGGFAHNRQGLRIVDWLEKRHPLYDGLNLTAEVRESLLKHQAKDVPERAEFPPRRQPFLEAQLVDLADSVAYDHHDLDDGLRERMFAEADLERLALWRRASLHAEKETPGLSGKMKLRRTTNALIGILIGDLTLTSASRLKEAGFRSADDARDAERPAIAHSAEIAAEMAELEDFLYRTFYRHWRINRATTRAKRLLGELFDALVASPEMMPPDHSARCDRDGAPRAVCDYVAGMTDRFARDEHRSVV